MKERRYIIRGPQQVALVGTILEEIPHDGSVEVRILPYKKNRSYEANRFYWAIIKIIADEIGHTKKELHEIYKRKFLIKILARDDEAFYDLLQVVAKGGTEGDRKTFAKLTSTTGLSVKQFSEYIQEIIDLANGLGIILPTKD